MWFYEKIIQEAEKSAFSFLEYNKLMTKSRIFLVLSLSFILGIFLASFFKPDAVLIYMFAIISVIIISLGYKNKKALVLSGALLFFALGIWRTEQKLNILNDLPFEQKEFSGEAVVVKEPVQKEDYQQITAETSLGSSTPKLRVLINANKYKEINYGDKLAVSCVLQVPENKDESFDYKMYLAKDGIYYLCQKPQIENLNKNEGNRFYLGILRIKNKLEENIDRVIPQPEAALGSGIILGGSSRMSKNIQDDFSRTGMTHIVAVSGYNVTIIAEYLIWFFIFIGFWRKQAFWFAVAGIIIFVAMTGFPSSAVRAGVMGTLLIWAMKNGRLANSWNAIIFAGAVMLLINPLSLRWDVGFQLSFLATIGIIALSPFWEKYMARKHKAFGFTEIFFLTLSAQIFVIPIILYNFHTLSLVSLAANLLVLLVVPISMLLVFLTAMAGLISGLLSLPFAWLAFLLLKYVIWTVGTLADLEWASRKVENFGWQWAGGWYLMLFLIIYFLKKKLNAKQKSGLWNLGGAAGT